MASQSATYEVEPGVAVSLMTNRSVFLRLAASQSRSKRTKNLYNLIADLVDDRVKREDRIRDLERRLKTAEEYVANIKKEATVTMALFQYECEPADEE